KHLDECRKLLKSDTDPISGTANKIRHGLARFEEAAKMLEGDKEPFGLGPISQNNDRLVNLTIASAIEFILNRDDCGPLNKNQIFKRLIRQGAKPTDPNAIRVILNREKDRFTAMPEGKWTTPSQIEKWKGWAEAGQAAN
ncbi:MAG: hypothetical protein AAGA96_15400, partial [Verrucomicrobiota bacterium]